MKKLLLSVSLISTLIAQPELLWEHVYTLPGAAINSFGSSIIETSDSGYFIAGSFPPLDSSHVFFLKVDENGDSSWTKHYDYRDSEMAWGFNFGGASEFADNGYLYTQHIYSPRGMWGWDFNGTAIFRTDLMGDTVLTMTLPPGQYPGVIGSLGQYSPAVPTDDHGFILGGNYLDEDEWNHPALYKYDSTGNQEWIKTYYANNSIQAWDHRLWMATKTGEDEILLVGEQNSELFALKTSFDGDSLWATTFEHRFGVVASTSEGGYIGIVGEFGGGKSEATRDVIRMDETLSPIWIKTLNGRLRSVSEAPDGGFIFTGWPGILKTDASGDSLWYFNSPEDEESELRVYAATITSDNEIVATGSYEVSPDNWQPWIGKLADDSTVITSVRNDGHGPMTISLLQNYPNPFNPSTTISYDLPEQSTVTLTVFDIAGREVATLEQSDKSPGKYEVQWNGLDQSGNSVSTGVYFARLQAGDYSKTIKMVSLR